MMNASAENPHIRESVYLVEQNETASEIFVNY